MAEPSKAGRPAGTASIAKADKNTPASVTAIRDRNKRNHGVFVAKVTVFMLCLGCFTYYFWPWGNTAIAPEFRHAHIRNLNSTDFEPYVLKEDGQIRIIKFYANWCDHCKTMAPLWSEAAAQNSNPKVEFLQVECSNNNKLCRKANVQGFPHLKIFYQGRIGYSRIGAMNESELATFVQEGVRFTQEGHVRAIATEIEQEKDMQEEKLAQAKAEQHSEL